MSDEFFKQVFQELLRGEQRRLVQLLLPQIVVVVHRLWRNKQEETSANGLRLQQTIILETISLLITFSMSQLVVQFIN